MIVDQSDLNGSVFPGSSRLFSVLTCPQPDTRQYRPGAGATGGMQATVSDVDCESLINDRSKSNVCALKSLIQLFVLKRIKQT